MKVFLASAIPERQTTFVPWVEILAGRDRFRTHSLTDDPDEADIILFLDGNSYNYDFSLKAIRRHPLTIKHRRKTFLYDERDQTWCAMPGLYVSMTKGSFNPQRQRAVSYVSMMNEFVLMEEYRHRQPDLLFSFLGRRVDRTREAILALSHPRGLVEDTSNFDVFKDSEGGNDGKRRYAEILGRSKFVLCPKGAGPASFRLFETMAIGRVPVIISDDWVAPTGPDWGKFALRIAERDVLHVAAIIEANEIRFEEMARTARAAWEEWFSPEVLFHRMIENCREIMANRLVPEGFRFPLLDSRFLYLWARSAKWKLHETVTRALRPSVQRTKAEEPSNAAEQMKGHNERYAK
ncbi:MAG: exostosin family protein [Gloeobacteraceae cyanobacterium ES-bin-144]|nr:exostosin family protein [Verrucomicrobiales bacterium]